jgi:hypothetical protein
MTTELNPRGRVYDTTKPTPENNGTYAPMRANRYGEQMVRVMDQFAWMDQGSLFVAHNAINDASTTLAGHAAPVLADADDTLTKPFLFIRNPTGSTKRIVPLYFEVDVVTAGANGTTDNYAWQLDSGATRISSGGTALTIVNPNMDSAEASVLSATGALLAGAPVAGAESANARHGGHGQIRAAIHLAGDRYTYKFGGEPGPGANVVATAASRHTINLPPISLGAEDQFLLAFYAPSQSAAAVYKTRLVWLELA